MTIEEFEKFDIDHTVCECYDVTLASVLEAVKAGHNSIEALMEELDAGSACELCQCKEIDEDGDRELHLEEILEYVKEKNVCLK